MSKFRAVDEMDETELRAELVAILTEGFMRYIKSERYAVDQSNRQKSPDFETARLELRPETVLSVNSRVNDR